jgi:hypothetical protein
MKLEPGMVFKFHEILPWKYLALFNNIILRIHKDKSLSIVFEQTITEINNNEYIEVINKSDLLLLTSKEKNETIREQLKILLKSML